MKKILWRIQLIDQITGKHLRVHVVHRVNVNIQYLIQTNFTAMTTKILSSDQPWWSSGPFEPTSDSRHLNVENQLWVQVHTGVGECPPCFSISLNSIKFSASLFTDQQFN